MLNPTAQQFGVTISEDLVAKGQTSHPGALIWSVDSDLDFSRQLQRKIESANWCYLNFRDSHSLEKLLEETAPHLLIVEPQLSAGTDFNLVLRLRNKGYSFPIVAISTQAGLEDRIRGLEAGCNDYLAKPISARELELRIENLLQLNNGSTIQISEIRSQYQIGTLRFTPAAATISQGSLTARLSRGEAALLAIFCESPTLTLTREQLVRASGSLVDANNSRSLDMRISKLRKLLVSMDPGIDYPIESVRGRGYRLRAHVSKVENVHGGSQIEIAA